MAELGGSNVPQIRVKGFEGEWNTLMLGELGQVATNKRIFIHQTSSTGDVPFYKIGTFGKKPKLFISQRLFETYKERFPYPLKGDLLISVIGSIGRVVEYRGENEYFQDSNIVWLQHNGAIVNTFLKQFYSFVKWSGLEGSTIKHLYNKNILETQIQLPSQKEQIKIGSYFEKLDRMIGLHQRKHEKLVTMKKAMLKKMFIAPGASVPEIRFKGFSEPWKEKSLEDLTERVQGNDGRMDLPTLTISAANGWLDQRDRFYSNIAGNEQKNYSLLKKGQLSYNHGNSKLAKYGVVFELVNFEEALVPRVYHSFKTNEDAEPSFIEYLFATKIPDKELGKLISSGARMDGLLNISYTAFMGIPISIPSKKEQQKIGTYFRQLDELITKHGTQLGKLKQIKTACLGKMFV